MNKKGEANTDPLDGTFERTLALPTWTALTLHEGIAFCEFNECNEKITRWYPSEGWNLRSQDVELIRFNKMAKPEEVIPWLQGRGYVPIGLPELLSIGCHYPDEQRQGNIIALEAPKFDGLSYYPVLCGYPVWRSLDLWLYILVAGGQEHLGGLLPANRFAVKKIAAVSR